MHIEFFSYELPSNEDSIMKEAKQTIEIHEKLASTYCLDKCLTLNTANPFDNF